MTIYKLWRKIDLLFQAENDYENPYMDVDLWVRLEGPDFCRDVYGFWNGGNEFVVRITATAPGEWRWRSFCNRDDSGLAGRDGQFVAESWTGEEKAVNLCRRGFLRPTPNGKAFMHADGTPCYYIADTWWAVPTFRFPWYDDEEERPVGPDMGYKDMVKYRKRQGYNGIAMLAAYPTWAEDEYPARFSLDDDEKTPVRGAWKVAGNLCDDPDDRSGKAKDMHNEGGRPFQFPGWVKGCESLIPDFTRINPEYFKYMDRKVDYLNERGMIPFIEVARRDVSNVWKKYYPWPESYARYVYYVFARYQANNVIMSPIHFDTAGLSIPSREYNEPINMAFDTFGLPAFGQPVGTNAETSTLINYGSEARWLSFHQIGNRRRTHDSFWYLTQLHRKTSLPALNGEPYYPGFPDDEPPANSRTAEEYSRSALYGSFLSGGFAGHIYGVEGLWGGEIDEKARYKTWDALEFRSGAQVPYLLRFMEPAGERYINLAPEPGIILPNQTGPTYDLTGWAYCAATRERDIILGYFENGYDPAEGLDPAEISGNMYKPPRTPRIRSGRYYWRYLLRWFDPREGVWLSETAVLESDNVGEFFLPEFPSEGDWGFALTVLT